MQDLPKTDMRDTLDAWDEIHDCLSLAMDEVESGLCDKESAKMVVMHLRPAMKQAAILAEVLE